MSAHQPILPADPKHMAKSVVRSHRLAFCAELLVALVEGIEAELQEGWLTDEDEMAEGSLQQSAAFDALESFQEYIASCRHPEGEITIGDWSGASGLGVRV